MAQTERYGTRCNAYSAWHRLDSIMRFVPSVEACAMSQIDLDFVVETYPAWSCFQEIFVEYEEYSEPLALIETAIDIGQNSKCANVTRRLSEMAGIPSYCVLYKLDQRENPAAPGVSDISEFRVKSLNGQSNDWKKFSPQDYADWLLHKRNELIKQKRT